MSDRRTQSDERLACTLAVFVDGSWINIPSSEFIQQFTLELPSGTGWRGTVTLFDGHSNKLENLSARIKPNTLMRFSFGALDNSGGLDAPVYEARTVTPNFRVSYDGFGVTYSFIGNAGLAWKYDAPTATTPFKRGKSCVDVFKAVAAYAEWDKLGDRLIIEPTDAVLPSEMHWAKNTSAVAFSKQLAEETQFNGQKFEFCITPRNGGTVIFATRAYAAAKAKQILNASGAAVHQYTFARDAMGEVIEFSVNDTTLNAAFMGATNSEVKGTDSTTGDVKAVSVRDDAGQRVLETDAPVQQAATRTPSAPRFDARWSINLPDAFGDDRSKQEAVKWYDRVQRATMQGHISVRGTHDLMPLDTIEIIYNTAQTARHFLSNTYKILLVSHVFDMGGWVTATDFFTDKVPDNYPTNTGDRPDSLVQSDAGLRTLR